MLTAAASPGGDPRGRDRDRDRVRAPDTIACDRARSRGVRGVAPREGSSGKYGDAGSIAVFTAVFAFSVLLLLGVLVDGGNALTARERAADVAEQAARAAVTDLSIENLHASQATTSPSPGASPSPSVSPTPSASTGTGTGAETVAIDWTTACTYAQQTVTDYAATEGDVTAVTMTKCGEGADALTATVTVTVTTKPAIPVPGFDSPMTMTATQSATAECGNADQQEVC